jgi:hypothetical protein
VGATLTPDAFMAQQGSAAPPLTPDSFMQAQPGQAQSGDPLDTKAKTAAELPSRESFEASHQGAVANWWQKVKAVTEAAAPLVMTKGEQLANEPLIPESVMPAPATTPAGAVGRSALEFARGMTSPENIAIGALAGPFGKIAPLLGRAVSAGFGLQMLKGAYDQYPEVRDAIEKKDWTRAAGAITTAALSGGLGVMAGAHAVRGGGEVPPPEGQTPIEKATASARAGVEALTPDGFMQEQEQEQEPASPASNTPAPETPAGNTLTPAAFMASSDGGANAEVPTLPRDLAGANPRYSYGSKQFDLNFANDLDKAAYITAQARPSARDADYLKFVMDQTGMSEAAVRNHGLAIRSSIKSQAAGAEPGRLDVDQRLGMPSAPTAIASLNPSAAISPGPAAIAEPAEEAARALVGGPATPDEFMAAEPQPALTPGVQPEGQPAVDTAASTPREPATPPVIGRDTNVLVPGETTTYPARYAVRELADVQPSHNPFSFEPNPNYEWSNDRDYSRAQNAARVVQNAAPDTFNPDYPTTDSPTAEHGAPIIDASGNVLGGNSRTMSIARVYQRGGPDVEMYRNAIADKAAQFGIDPAELDRFQQPLLVRELGGGIDAQRAITDFNKSAPAALSPEEQAVSDGRRLSPQTVQDIAGRLDDLGEEGTLASALRGDDGAAVLNRLVNDGVLTEQEKGGYLDDRGNLTPEAKSRIGKALVGRLFDTPAEFRETTPAVRAKLERIAPNLLRVEGRPDWSLTDATRQAIALSEDARVHKMPVEDAAAQSVIGGERSYSPEAIDVAKTLEQGPVKAAGAFRRYANDEALSREGSQSAFFTPPTRMEAFTDAFRPLARSSERGGIDPNLLSLGVGKFVQEDVIPAAKRVASDLVEAKDDVMRVVAPQTRGSAAEFTGLNLRQRMAQFARRFDQGEQRLRDARRFFNTRAPEDNYRFIDNVERGLGRGPLAGRQMPPADAALEPIARMFSKMLDQRRSEVQALGEGALKGFYQNYFPHIFERPEQAARFIDSFFSGRRSMEGPKSFLKHREFPTFREALDAGLKPVSDNPVDLVMIKAREMDRYLLAHAVLRDLAENGIAKRVSGLGPDARQAEMLGGAPVRPEWAVEKKTDLPPDFVSIRDPVGGGKWYASEGAADVLNNFLSPGLRGRSGLFRTLLGVNNTMNQANLGLSAFHLRAVSISAMAGRMGLGAVKAMEGHPLDAAFHIFTSPAAPFIDFVKGSKVLHDWFKPGSEGAPIAAMTDALMKGGGRARMDPFYQNAMAEKMATAFRRGNYIGGAIRSPFAAIETMAKPLMNYLVPRMKIGAFADMAQHEMEKLGPGAKVVDVQRAMSAAWDHVENRLGQMTYDNRFWNRTFKDIAMLSVRSVGWSLGDFLEGKSAIGAVKQMATLKRAGGSARPGLRGRLHGDGGADGGHHAIPPHRQGAATVGGLLLPQARGRPASGVGALRQRRLPVRPRSRADDREQGLAADLDHEPDV